MPDLVEFDPAGSLRGCEARARLTVPAPEVIEQLGLERLGDVLVFPEDGRLAVSAAALQRRRGQVLGGPCRDAVPTVVGGGVGGPDEQIRDRA